MGQSAPPSTFAVHAGEGTIRIDLVLLSCERRLAVAVVPGRHADYPAQLTRLLDARRFEVIPANGIEEKVGILATGTTVTVTCSPRHGVDRTVEVSERLAARGYRVVPHLAARMVRDRGHLRRIVERLAGVGVGEAFVVGGDASPPSGVYRDAGDLLEDLRSLPHTFARIGVGGYPEGHPLIGATALLEALRRKQAYADHVVTQICFDPAALAGWIRSIRDAGVTLPVIVGLPGVVERRKLAEISLQTGVGASLRYLVKNRRQIASLARSRRYDPTPCHDRWRRTSTTRGWTYAARTSSPSTRSRRHRSG
jgi:methylenetetrahydrofolate reductase (NADPH)